MKQVFEKKLINLIHKYRQQGYTESDIRSALQKKNYPSPIIDRLLAKANPEPKDAKFTSPLRAVK